MCVNQEQTSLYYIPIHTKRFSRTRIGLFICCTHTPFQQQRQLLYKISSRLHLFSVAVYFHYYTYIYIYIHYIHIIYYIYQEYAKKIRPTTGQWIALCIHHLFYHIVTLIHIHYPHFVLMIFWKHQRLCHHQQPWSIQPHFGHHLLLNFLSAYTPEALSVSTTALSNEISPPNSHLISPQKHVHHRHQYHPYLSVSRHSPTAKLQHDPTSILTASTNKSNYQHALSPLAMKDKIQQQHIDRKGGMFKQEITWSEKEMKTNVHWFERVIFQLIRKPNSICFAFLFSRIFLSLILLWESWIYHIHYLLSTCISLIKL